MDINEEITKMNLYKTFEPYIDKSVTMEDRLKARVRLCGYRAAGSKRRSCQMDSHEAEITAVLKARYQETENADSVLVTVCVFDLS